MVKLIVSDIDGTLVKDGADNINKELFPVIEELKKKGILFAAASGRQYPSIRRLFGPVQDNVVFIAENGAYVVCRGTEMAEVPMKRVYVEQIVADMRRCTDCILTASGKEATYIESRDEEFVDLLVNGYHNTIEIVDDVLAADATIIKLALYCKEGIAKAAEALMPKWSDKVKVVIAGAQWLDFMDFSVDKGSALAKIQQITGIKKEETICFGDNSNDIGMFHQAGKSFAVGSAREEVKAEADEVIQTYKQNSVLNEIKKLL